MDKATKYYNPAQLLFAAANPRNARLRYGRGTGKTEGPICFRMVNTAVKMPQSNNAFVVPSYQKFLKDLLPPIRKGLKLYGLYENEHWMIGEKPPKWWGRAIYPSDDYKHVLTFRNGAQYALFSQDSKTKNQGTSLISVIGDEAKLLDYERIKEDIINAMRGSFQLWGDVVEFNSQLYVSDGWRREKDFGWFFEDEKKANQEEMEHLIRLALVPNPSPEILSALDYARKNTFFYHKASAYENRHTLGIDYFKNAYENNTPLQFLVSNLNFDMNRIEGSFYIYLNEERQGYYAASQSYYENLGYDESKINQANCEGDTDINYNIPLELSFDFGGKINFSTVTQWDKKANVIYLLKDFVEPSYEEIVNVFTEYYRPFLRKNGKVKLFYDIEANKIQKNSKTTYAEDIRLLLEKKGWGVEMAQSQFIDYIPHNTKYNIWKKVLYEGEDRDKRFPKFRFNRTNAERTSTSMGMAPQIDKEGVIQKDKSAERRKSVDPVKATHLSDTVDNAVCFQLIPIYDENKYVSWI